MGLHRKLRICQIIWGVCGFFLIWAGLYISQKFIFLLYALLFGVGLYSMSLRCPNCGWPATRNKVKFFGIEMNMWTPWIPPRCQECNYKLEEENQGRHRAYPFRPMEINVKKKKPMGVIVFGILGIIFSLLNLSPFIFEAIRHGSITYIIQLQSIGRIIPAFGWLACSIWVLGWLNLARIGTIIAAMYYLIDTFNPSAYFWETIPNLRPLSLVIRMLGFIFFCSTIYYFTRPNVKEHFRKND